MLNTGNLRVSESQKSQNKHNAQTIVTVTCLDKFCGLGFQRLLPLTLTVCGLTMHPQMSLQFSVRGRTELALVTRVDLCCLLVGVHLMVAELFGVGAGELAAFTNAESRGGTRDL